MHNNEGIFSFHELSQLRDFCNNCAKEDKRIHEQRKINSSYVPEDNEPKQIKKVTKTNNNKINNINKSNSNVKIKNNYQENLKPKKVNVNYNDSHKHNYNSKMNSDTFKNRLKMFEPK